MKQGTVRRSEGTTTINATVRWSWRSCRRIRPAVENVILMFMRCLPLACPSRPRCTGCSQSCRHLLPVADQPEKSPVETFGAGLGPDRSRCVIADQPALADQQQPVAAPGLVHHVAGDQEGGAPIGENVELRPEVGTQHR